MQARAYAAAEAGARLAPTTIERREVGLASRNGPGRSLVAAGKGCRSQRNALIFRQFPKCRPAGLRVPTVYRDGVEISERRAGIICADQHDAEVATRRTGQVVVPKVVVHRLKIPDQFTGGGVESNDTVAVQVFSFPVSTVKIVGR